MKPSLTREPWSRTVVRTQLADRIRPQLEAIFELARHRGRVPATDELPDDVIATLQDARVSRARAIVLAATEFGSDELVLAANARCEDLRVHFALSNFPGVPSYSALPRSIQRDVKALLGSPEQALAQGRELLFSAGRRELILSASPRTHERSDRGRVL